MDGVSARVYKGLKRYWRRRGYDRLNVTGRRRMNRAELGRSGSSRRKRFWRIKITPRLRFSPKKFLIGLRDAYVNFMLRIASSPVINGGYGGPVGGGFGKGQLKEYDEKMIVEIYKSLVVAQGQLAARDAAKIGPQIVCRP
ncbi:hypothetical protein Acr_17g0001320 [Actinidia rufa]|uniref:Uncharacterized protein n=1 Tax=Actinidia rufa TaxID=165716 RepID=A0A7J0G1A7_9ERIC|nr:hypothetical protein Acr_17g0001320 [Actinidia rufa]